MDFAALATLYEEEERPKNAIEFLKTQFGAPTLEEFAQLKIEKQSLEDQLQEAQSRIEELQLQINAHKEEETSSTDQVEETTSPLDNAA